MLQSLNLNPLLIQFVNKIVIKIFVSKKLKHFFGFITLLNNLYINKIHNDNLMNIKL